MFLRKHWIPLSVCLIIASCALGYLLVGPAFEPPVRMSESPLRETTALKPQPLTPVETETKNLCGLDYYNNNDCGHDRHDICGYRICNPEKHRAVRTCNQWVWGVPGCGQTVYACNWQDYRPIKWACEHTKKICGKGIHGQPQIECPLGPMDQICSFGKFYPCSPHEHTYREKAKKGIQ